jgi:hypothetical protein
MTGGTAGVRVVSHAAEWTPAVLAFNARVLERGGWGFYPDPECEWLPRRPDARVWREFHLAVDGSGEVRGAFALKPQPWWIDGREVMVADHQGPMSEGAVEPRWAPLALRLAREMRRLQPLLYSWGHGGDQTNMVQLLARLGWLMHATPLCVHVRRPYRFLRQSRYLRTSRSRALALDLLAWSGVGALGIAGYQHIFALAAGPGTGIEAEPFEVFGEWSDALWERCRPHYAALAVRDAAVMNALLPEGRWPPAIKLRVRHGNETIGWAAVMNTRFTDDARFGSLQVGSLIDCLAEPRHSTAVALAAKRFLVSQDVDLIVSNQAHPSWISALARCGFAVMPGRRLFAVSPALQALLQPWTTVRHGLHLTNLDGHGPHSL